MHRKVAAVIHSHRVSNPVGSCPVTNSAAALTASAATAAAAIESRSCVGSGRDQRGR